MVKGGGGSVVQIVYQSIHTLNAVLMCGVSFKLDNQTKTNITANI